MDPVAPLLIALLGITALTALRSYLRLRRNDSERERLLMIRAASRQDGGTL